MIEPGSRREFLRRSLVGAISWQYLGTWSKANAATNPSQSLKVPLEEFSYGAVKLGDGLHKKQFEETMQVILNLNEDSLLKPFRLRAGLPAPGADLGGWYDEDPAFHLGAQNEHGFAPGHSFGQWVSSLCRAYAITGSPVMKSKAERLLFLYAKTISPKFYSDFRWPTYTYDKLVCALNDAHQYIDFKDSFALLEKTTNTALRFFPEKALDHDEMRERTNKDDSFCWDESYTLPENLFIAYQRGAGARYKQLATRYLKDDTYFDPLSQGINILPGHHAYSYTNALSSAMQAYLTLGSEKHLQAAKNAFEMIKNTQSYASGGWGPDESFRPPGSEEMAESLNYSHHNFETPCGSYAHFKLCRYLLRVSADAKYGDSLEQVMYNTVLGAKKLEQDGRAFYYSDYNFAGKKVYRDKWTCCSGTLPQVTCDYHVSAYFHDDSGVYVNLYIPSTLTWYPDKSKAAGQNAADRVQISQRSNYPLDGQIELVVRTPLARSFNLHLRIPEWAKTASLKVNDQNISAKDLITNATAGGFACIKRLWFDGDRIELNLPMEMRLEPLDQKHPKLVALLRGPLVLFPITTNKICLNKQQLLSAKRTNERGDEWIVETQNERIRFLPFTSIDNEQYSTYLELI